MNARLRRLRTFWPWMILAVAVGSAVWHDVDFPEDVDPEFPAVVRPTFSRRPPPAYRLAEPGDTIDRVAIYFSSAAIVLSAAGVVLSGRKITLWHAAFGVSLAAFWHASTPGPTFDGWHTLGFREIFNPLAPARLRIILASASIALLLFTVFAVRKCRPILKEIRDQARGKRVGALLVLAAILFVLSQFDIPGVEPAGYWPRCAWSFSLLAYIMALLRLMPAVGMNHARIWRWGLRITCASAWFLIVDEGIDITWYHRPLARMRTVVPGQIYICAMPTKRGLEVAHQRHHFRTIINVFPEYGAIRSPILPDEIEFAKSHGIRYVASPYDAASSDSFLDETLRLACDPEAWPILLHCHGCMDRSPAWMGIYRFVVQGRPLDEVMREIEQHRGVRPKASVTLLYNRVLPSRAGEQYFRDPTAALLRRCAEGTADPFYEILRTELEGPNHTDDSRVSQRIEIPTTR